jgi:hypothetical protein
MPQKKPEGSSAGSSIGSKGTHYGVAAIAIGLSAYIWWVTGDPSTPPEHPKPSLFQDAVIDVPLTLVTADKTDLACASEQEFEGYHCAFKKTTEAWPDLDATNAEHRKKMLVPYMTVDNVMFLIPGMFEDPAIDERYRDEVPRKLPRDRLERFTAQCKLTLRKEVEGVMVRWNPTGDWQGPNKVWIGEVSNCQVSEP